MYLTDTHSHLYLKEFEQDVENVIERAKLCNVSKILLPNIDVDSLNKLLNLVNSFPDMLYPMIGLHPTSVDKNFSLQLSKMFNDFNSNKFVAVGEIGLDLYWDKTFHNEQIEAFKFQLEFAVENNLPVVVHARETMDEIISILKEYRANGLQGVLHSFTGNMEQALELINLGFYIGVGGISTFKNAGIDKIVAKLPLERILLETDSPYLAPVPKRGKRNESSYLEYIAKNLAKLHNVEYLKVVSTTTQNAIELFNL